MFYMESLIESLIEIAFYGENQDVKSVFIFLKKIIDRIILYDI